ncbi:hypothetical protein DFH09DRAFT_1211618 [Mycena vulgaris]|nr:hypothetical protein DFH09DRAFT_1211618 [Mycena vulgaris]
MSSREPLWYCHECNAEMRPLMFVEKMENPTDDPREFHRQGAPDPGGEDLPLGLETFLFALQGMAERGAAETRTPTRAPEQRFNGPRVTRTFEFRSGSGPTRSVRLGSPLGPNPLGGENPDQPTMADFMQRRPDGGAPGITGPIMARYLMALLGREHLTEMFARGMTDGPQSGRMGDYVFNQEALDQIITQLMETSNSGRPVPATDEIVEQLPREVLELGSPTLEKDCAVCKDQFKLDTEDPDEQIVVTLPCKHPFHEPCILPWLKSSGTCPVCRHALVPQPEHHAPPPAGTSSGARPRGTSSLFGYMGNGNPPSGSSSRSERDTTGQSSNHVPGGWDDELDIESIKPKLLDRLMREFRSLN